jgi:uncharacterized protein YbbC (DUF1343 family)
MTVLTGLEMLLTNPPNSILDSNLGLLCNPASVDSGLHHARALINDRFPGRLKALYSPQHGFFSEKQDNMIESSHLIDPLLSVPVYSLYGETRIPTRQMLDTIDILLIDLQDVGTRVYTFASTVSYCMEAAGALGKKVIVLDRPNPISGLHIEGNPLSMECRSFVGRYPIPMRHGLTMGELAIYFKKQFRIECDLEIIPMKGWSRKMFFSDTGLAWVLPSPNLPTPDAAIVYPGQVIWEGTNISEGRGTTLPFSIFGAPFFDHDTILSVVGGPNQPGCFLREMAFEPTANKWAHQLCKGFQIHVTDRKTYRPYETSLRLLQAVVTCYPDRFEWKSPPYEYEWEKLPIDLILGDKSIRMKIENKIPVSEIAMDWQGQLTRFSEMSPSVWVYEN